MLNRFIQNDTGRQRQGTTLPLLCSIRKIAMKNRGHCAHC